MPKKRAVTLDVGPSAGRSAQDRPSFDVAPSKERAETKLPFGGRIRSGTKFLTGTKLRHQTSTFRHRKDVLLEPLYSGQTVHVGDHPDGPIDRVRSLIKGEKRDERKVADGQIAPSLSEEDKRPIFCEMMELMPDAEQQKTEGIQAVSDNMYIMWSLVPNRWIKFEETVEEAFTRFSKPHIGLLTVQCILQMRNCLHHGASHFDLDVSNFRQLASEVSGEWMKRHELSARDTKNIMKVLMSPKMHMFKSKMRNLQRHSSTEDTIEMEADANRQSYQSENSDSDVALPKKMDKSLYRKLPSGTEAAVVMVGHLPELYTTVTEFVRLKRPLHLHPELPEMPVPVRFLFILFFPKEHYKNEATILGRCMASLFIDDVFSRVAYCANSARDLADGVDEFLSQTLIVAPNKLSISQRLEPHDDAPHTARKLGAQANYEDPIDQAIEESKNLALKRTGYPCGGLINDIKRKAPWYPSDFVDALRPSALTQTLSGTVLLFFANIAKIITYGGVMQNMLKKNMGAVENLISSGICGVIYGLFSGQPLSVLSATGPTLIFEYALFNFCEPRGLDYLTMRLWVALWTAGLLILLVITDASALIGYITRFTQESFATLIALIFIIQSFIELFGISHEFPIITNPQELLKDSCSCNVTQINFTSSSTQMATTSYSTPMIPTTTTAGNGTQGQCSAAFEKEDFHPDVFLFSIILCFATFGICITLKFLRHSGFFPSWMRKGIADFNVFFAIAIMTFFNWWMGIGVPGLAVPDSLSPTDADNRGWLIDPRNIEHWWLAVAAVGPAIFFTILVFMDQQITAVIVNRKDNKLEKGYGYHLDLLLIALMMVLCAVAGAPFKIAATVISIMNLESLKKTSETAAPGEKPTFLGVREQRVTTVVAHILIGLSVFLTPILKLLPLPVLLGIFLYMGTVTLMGQQFVSRLTILFMPMKHQPDYPWLRAVHLKRVHLFTLFQIIGVVLLFAVKQYKPISMAFPLVLIIIIVVRILIGYLFTDYELEALDDPMPGWKELMSPSSTTSEVKHDDEVEMGKDDGKF